MNSPKVSVLIPTFNYARFLGEAIQSVLTQDFQDWELLIVDDCSTDNTAEVVQPFCARDARVRFSVNSPNLGMVNNWNHCLELARGEYVKFLFGDDKLCHPQALGKMVALLEQHPEASLAASARNVLDENSRIVEVWQTLPEGIHDGQATIQSCVIQNMNLVGEPSAVLFRKKDAQRGFDAQYRQVVDLAMWFHLLEQGKLAYTREPLCAFRRHATQQTARNIEAGFAYEEHVQFLMGYALKKRLPRRIFFPQLYDLREAFEKRPDEVTPRMRVLERQLAAYVGITCYAYFWTKRKLTRPFKKLVNSIKKRLPRRQPLLNP